VLHNHLEIFYHLEFHIPPKIKDAYISGNIIAIFLLKWLFHMWLACTIFSLMLFVFYQTDNQCEDSHPVIWKKKHHHFLNINVKLYGHMLHKHIHILLMNFHYNYVSTCCWGVAFMHQNCCHYLYQAIYCQKHLNELKYFESMQSLSSSR
jgi:hypothetical protein